MDQNEKPTKNTLELDAEQRNHVDDSDDNTSVDNMSLQQVVRTLAGAKHEGMDPATIARLRAQFGITQSLFTKKRLKRSTRKAKRKAARQARKITRRDAKRGQKNTGGQRF